VTACQIILEQQVVHVQEMRRRKWHL